MILYLDTSALLKLYIIEEDSVTVASAMVRAESVSTSILTYVETCSALARRHAESDLSDDEHTECLRYFEMDWQRFSVVHVTVPLVHHAAGIAENHRLRAMDSLQLASAAWLKMAAGAPVTLVCADRALHEAALALGLDAMLVG